MLLIYSTMSVSQGVNVFFFFFFFFYMQIFCFLNNALFLYQFIGKNTNIEEKSYKKIYIYIDLLAENQRPNCFIFDQYRRDN